MSTASVLELSRQTAMTSVTLETQDCANGSAGRLTHVTSWPDTRDPPTEMSTADAPVIYTVGHSTRSLAELLELLSGAGVSELVDVRSVPRSRRHPHFSGDALARDLPARGIEYTHEPTLGGFRSPTTDSPNGGWQHQSFRGYADHMESEEFQAALQRLAHRGRAHTSALMCAESNWRRCHRRLIADALLVRGWRVRHLGLERKQVPHELTPFAVLGPDERLTYPPLQVSLLEGPS